MPAPSEKPLSKLCIRIFTEDELALRELAAASGGSVAMNTLIRSIIHNYIVQMRDIQRKNIDKIKPEQLQIDLEDIGLN